MRPFIIVGSLFVTGMLSPISVDAQRLPPLDAPVVAGPLGARLDTQLRQAADSGFSGAVLVAVRGTMVLLQGYGMANIATGERNTPATRFDFGSITKTLTGVAILRLDASGMLSVNDPLARVIGAVDSSKSRATIDQVAKHLSGFVAAGSSVSDTSRDGFVLKMKTAPGEAEPGTQYRYTNAGTSLLAAIVELRSGMPFADFVRREVFAPAGIQGGFRWESEWNNRRARGYVGKPDGPPEETQGPPVDWGIRGATGWIGTVGDVYRFHVALRSGRLLPRAQQARTLDSTVTEAYGFHDEPHSKYGVPLVHKGGDFPGSQTQFLWLPAQDVVIIWANNDQRTRWRDRLNTMLMNAVLAESSPGAR